MAVGLSACVSRPENGALALNREALVGTEHSILVAATRQKDGRPDTYFNGERAQYLSYATMTLSVPPAHAAGQIEWPSKVPGDPRTDIVMRDGRYVDGEKDFLRTLNTQLAARPPGKRKVLIFVHGYNTTFAEALYRATQIVHDSRSPAVPVLFTWASRGRTTEYVYDNNSATAARDDLERTLRMIAASQAEEVNIVAHSMGNWVTVEALRQLKIGNKSLSGKAGAIVLAAPDIDIDVFKAQMRRFGKPSKPFFVVLSRDDRALELSELIAGGKERLGAYGNDAELAAMGAIVIDMSGAGSSDSMNHDKFAQLAQIAPALHQVLAHGVSSQPVDHPGSREGIISSLNQFSLRLASGTVEVIEQR
jgi:esterase/lipase superfamily enzyme